MIYWNICKCKFFYKKNLYKCKFFFIKKIYINVKYFIKKNYINVKIKKVKINLKHISYQAYHFQDLKNILCNMVNNNFVL